MKESDRLTLIAEPALLFGHQQATDDPRDGLTLFGPLDAGKPYGIRAGVIGTEQGVEWFRRWISELDSPLISHDTPLARPLFPGFEAAFRTVWSAREVTTIAIDRKEIDDRIRLDDKHQRVFRTVDLYASRILEVERRDDTKVDLWFVVVPDDVWKYCRPQSTVAASLRVPVEYKFRPAQARKLREQPALFPEMNEAGRAYQYEVNFRNQLKARMLRDRVLTQVVRESTVAFREVQNEAGRPLRDLAAMASAIAWTLSTAAFYKCGGRPWKLADVREGVCYVGLVFKQLLDPSSGNACCAAQMFLDSGDGIVFKGAIGPWYNETEGDYHLSRLAARRVAEMVLEEYKRAHGRPPSELFIHGKNRFTDEEWSGFESGVSSETSVTGVRIRPSSGLKLYREEGQHTVLRGLACIRDRRTAYLWSKGFVPRLRTYVGREVPNPLLIDICRGEPDMATVLADVQRLTKLNYNACQFADGLPVTLKFADAVGEVLTAGPVEVDQPPLPFRHYI